MAEEEIVCRRRRKKIGVLIYRLNCTIVHFAYVVFLCSKICQLLLFSIRLFSLCFAYLGQSTVMAEKPKTPLVPMPNGQEHCCEICGLAGLSDDTMLDHMKTYHIDGSADCPFCGLNGVDPAELLLHVNQAHLDYLTPENELMSFIDDQSPR